MYITKFYPNDGSNSIILAKTKTAKEAYDAHKRALEPDHTEESQKAYDAAFQKYRTSIIDYPDENTQEWADNCERIAEERHLCEKQLERDLQEVYKLIPFYPEHPEQIITTNQQKIIVAYGSDMKKIRKSAKFRGGCRAIFSPAVICNFQKR